MFEKLVFTIVDLFIIFWLSILKAVRIALVENFQTQKLKRKYFGNKLLSLIFYVYMSVFLIWVYLIGVKNAYELSHLNPDFLANGHHLWCTKNLNILFGQMNIPERSLFLLFFESFRERGATIYRIDKLLYFNYSIQVNYFNSIFVIVDHNCKW